MKLISALSVFACCLLAVGQVRAEQPIGAESSSPPPRNRSLSDADLEKLPQTIDVLHLRGSLAYGPDTVTDEGIRQLARYTKLRTLHADGLGLTDESLETIAQLPALEELSLDSNSISGAGLHHLQKLKSLRRLKLNFNHLDEHDFVALGDLTGLTSLSVLGRYVVDDRVLEQCARLTKLEELHLSEFTSGVTDRGIAQLVQLQRLRNFTLRDAPSVTDSGLKRLAELPQLQRASLSSLASISPSGLRFLEKLPEMRRLEISEIRLDEVSLRAIARLGKLEHLLLWSINSSSPLPLDCLGELRALREFRSNENLGSSAIRALAKLERLESIQVDLKQVSDDELTHLARLPKLRFLCLNSDQITPASLLTLARMKSLRELYVTDAVRITPSQWSSLGERSLPQCQIQLWFAPYTILHAPRQTSGASNAPSDMQRLGLLKPVMTLAEATRLCEGKRMIGQGCGGGNDEHGRPRGMFTNDYELILPNAISPQWMSFHYIQANPSYLIEFTGPGFRYRLKNEQYVPIKTND